MSSVPRFERDDGDGPTAPGPRRVGRPAPAPAAPAPIDIIVGGVVFGTVEPDRLKAKAQIDLERVRGALDLLAWCQHHAGVRAEDLPALEAELGEMELGAIVALAQSISAALGEAVAVPKARPPR